MRWNHPYRGLVRPGEFIGLAEDIGLIGPLTAWVLRSACRQQRLWQDQGVSGLQMSVNLSPVQFRERGVELLIERVLAESQLEASSLDLELTENAVIENSQTAIQSLRHLNQLGVSLSIDDFGTGYSSLSYIKRLPVQRLKIDQSFVQNLEHSLNDEVIVRAIINLGHSLGLRVIAEGVETEGQLLRLRGVRLRRGAGQPDQPAGERAAAGAGRAPRQPGRRSRPRPRPLARSGASPAAEATMAAGDAARRSALGCAASGRSCGRAPTASMSRR